MGVRGWSGIRVGVGLRVVPRIKIVYDEASFYLIRLAVLQALKVRGQFRGWSGVGVGVGVWGEGWVQGCVPHPVGL